MMRTLTPSLLSQSASTSPVGPHELVDFERAVNVTLGLPIVRTSPDHGTAYDLAGTGRARATSMLAALELAATMVDRRAG